MELLWDAHTERLRDQRAAEMEARVLKLDDAEMPFWYKVYGEPTERGRSLFISMHGGGGAPARLNDQQWENQKRLYQPEEGVYVAPRAPSNEWDLWHQRPVGKLLDRLIENMIVFEYVDPNRVYLMGYSAGGDGVYQLAPRMADRWAAAAMMAGHPNEASPLGLRNIGFILQVGGRDAAYKRNQIAAEWGDKLAMLQIDDGVGYRHLVKIYPDKGHWMDREDAIALPWMAEFERDPLPTRIVWHQDDVTRGNFYWLGVDDDQQQQGATVTATRDGRSIEITTDDVDRLKVYLTDRMDSLDKPWTITLNSEQVYEGVPKRTIAALAASLARRGDREMIFSAEVECGP